MMKKYILLLVLGLYGFSACSDFLSESPKTFISPENYFKNEEQMNGALWGCFEYLMSKEAYGSTFSWYTEAMSYSKAVPSSQIFHSYNLTPENTFINEVWVKFFQCIGSANYIIYLLDEKDIDLTDEAEACFRGEAYFYRALSYFNLVRLYGDLPIVTSLAENIDDLIGPREPIKDVYEEVIIPDLKNAVKLLPVVNPYDVGRAHKISAAGLLAKAYATMAGYPLNDASKWQEAKAVLETIVDPSNPSKALSPYNNALQEDMADLYYKCSTMDRNASSVIERRAVENGVESVFEINYNENSTYNGTGWCNFPNTDAFRQWANTAPWIFMDEPNTKNDSFDMNQPRYKFYLTSNDPRCYITLTTTYFHGGLAAENVQMKVPRVYQGSTQSFENNWVVMRYAELVLLLAEVENELNGPTALAKNCVNAIRQRARNSTPTSLDPESTLVDGTYPAALTAEETANKDIFREWIRREAITEFMFEGVNYFNFVRWHIMEEMLVWSRDAFDHANSNTRQWPGDHVYFWPIPSVQRSATNNVLSQNDGY